MDPSDEHGAVWRKLAMAAARARDHYIPLWLLYHARVTFRQAPFHGLLSVLSPSAIGQYLTTHGERKRAHRDRSR